MANKVRDIALITASVSVVVFTILFCVDMYSVDTYVQSKEEAKMPKIEVVSGDTVIFANGSSVESETSVVVEEDNIVVQNDKKIVLRGCGNKKQVKPTPKPAPTPAPKPVVKDTVPAPTPTVTPAPAPVTEKPSFRVVSVYIGTRGNCK